MSRGAVTLENLPARCLPEGDCWIWQGHYTTSGIPAGHVNGQRMSVRRIVLVLQGRRAPGPSTEERERLAAACSALARRSSAAEQWNHLADKERRLLAAYAGLRESNPGVPLGTPAARQWHEFSADERAAIGQGTRLLLRRIAALGALMQRWWVVE